MIYKTKDDIYIQEATRDMMVITKREISSKIKELGGPEGIVENAVVEKIAREMCNKELETCEKQLATQNKKVESYKKQVETQGLQMKNIEQKLNEVYGMLKVLPAFPDLYNHVSASAAGDTRVEPDEDTRLDLDEDTRLQLDKDKRLDFSLLKTPTSFDTSAPGGLRKNTHLSILATSHHAITAGTLFTVIYKPSFWSDEGVMERYRVND
ncbi:hypothetical protein Tco_0117637 [Tanacetum coccineum]